MAGAFGQPSLLGNYDFSSPFAKVSLIKNVGSPSEQVYDLWTPQGRGGADTVQPVKLTGFTGANGQLDDVVINTLSFVESVTVTLGLGYIPQMEVVLSPPFEEGRKLMESDLVDYISSDLTVTFGYYSGTLGSYQSPTFRGILQKPDISFGEEFTISFTAAGKAGYTAASNTVTKSAPKKQRRIHISDLLKELDLDPAENEWELDSYALSRLQQEIPLSYAGKTVLSCVYELARECGCWLNLVTTEGTSKVKLTSMSKIVGNAPVATLAFHDFHSQQVGPQIGVFPIISASTDTAGIYLGGNAKTFARAGVDKDTRESKSAEVTPRDIAVTGNKESNQIGVSDPAKSKKLDPSSSHEVDAQDAAKELEMISHANQIGIELKLECVGVPSLLPGQIVQVVGLSARIDDKYVVRSLTHTISGDGFNTSIDLFQNSSFMVSNAVTSLRSAVPNAYAPITPPPRNNSSAIQEPVTKTPSYRQSVIPY